MGDPACWLPQVCDTCGRIHDDPDTPCPEVDVDADAPPSTDG